MKTILGDKELDVYCLARLSETAVEIIFTNMAQLIKEGAVKAIGVSEMSAASLEKAHKVILHPGLPSSIWLTRSTRFAPSLSMRSKSPYSHTSPRSATLSPGAQPILSQSWLIPHLGKANSRVDTRNLRISRPVMPEPWPLGSRAKRSTRTKS